ncbi:ribosomal RNA processing protein [Dimargaris verticillata]|uniref:Ribosomal RNA processing protein n=1 Tax=Dimargaris verticillata TaxID=2761393 RepID=A0A9W8AZB8_9FUNG|nr:ribosomal RNA processing protein [Dimargaris verticillata]
MASPSTTSDSAVSFASLGIDAKLCDACTKLNFSTPTDIQREAIPWALKGRDIIGLAKTGSGKTAAFALPILHALWQKPHKLFACIMAPTRELAYQIAEVFNSLGEDMGVRCVTIVGGVDLMTQAIALSRQPHIVIATPGRLEYHLENTKGFSLRRIKYLVLDEADQLLNLDFGPTIVSILDHLNKDRVTFLFSATMTARVAKLQNASLKDPVKIEVATNLIQHYTFFPFKYKDCYLVHFLNEFTGQSAITFVRSCGEVNRLTHLLRHLRIPAVGLFGKMPMEKRSAALEKFKKGKRSVLVATDIASRGLDIPHVDVVLNYDLPKNSKEYIHRVGRTARAGRSGKSISFVTQYDIELYQRIEFALGKKLKEFKVESATVLRLQESVREAQRMAVLHLKEDRDPSRGDVADQKKLMMLNKVARKLSRKSKQTAPA